MSTHRLASCARAIPKPDGERDYRQILVAGNAAAGKMRERKALNRIVPLAIAAGLAGGIRAKKRYAERRGNSRRIIAAFFMPLSGAPSPVPMKGLTYWVRSKLSSASVEAQENVSSKSECFDTVFLS
jgi:hypothetical protein